MTLYPLIPQTFESGAITQLPEIDLFQFALAQVPSVYQNAPNFVGVLQNISAQKQILYETIRSLINSYNLNDEGDGTADATPEGVYAQMIASVFDAPYTQQSATNDDIINSTQNTVVFVNSRGYPSDFYDYFSLNGLDSYFTNENVEEDGNATIFFNVPIANTPDSPPNPLDIFQNATLKLKGAGIKVIIVGSNIPYFQYGSLPTDSPPYQVAPGNAGFGELRGNLVQGGGFYKSLD